MPANSSSVRTIKTIISRCTFRERSLRNYIQIHIFFFFSPLEANVAPDVDSTTNSRDRISLFYIPGLWFIENELLSQSVTSPTPTQRRDGRRIFSGGTPQRGTERGHWIADVQHRQRSVEIVTGFRQCEEASLSTFKRYVAKVSGRREEIVCEIKSESEIM